MVCTLALRSNAAASASDIVPYTLSRSWAKGELFEVVAEFLQQRDRLP